MQRPFNKCEKRSDYLKYVSGIQLVYLCLCACLCLVNRKKTVCHHHHHITERRLDYSRGVRPVVGI